MAKNKKYAKKRTVSKSDLSTMSVDDFMNGIGDNSDESSSEDLIEEKSFVNGSQRSEQEDSDASDSKEDDDGQALNNDTDNEDEDGDEESTQENDSNDENEGEDDEADPKSQSSRLQDSLNKLKDTDPEFYKFLKEHDESLLKFNLSDISDSEDEEESPIHTPAEKLEEHSDESDYEEDSAPAREYGQKLTLKVVAELQQKLQEDKTNATINEVVQAFHAALQRVSTDTDKERCRYKVEGSGVFNAVVQLCVLELLPGIKRYLKLPPGASNMVNSKMKRWTKLKGPMRSYLTDLLKLLGGLASTNTTSLLLKHIHQLSPFIVWFRTLRKHYLKKLISIWGEGEDTIRVLAFMCILKMTTLSQSVLLETVLKVMYLTYIKNSKFVSPNTLPGINFMRRSLNEMFLLDEGVTYTLAFLYIRQLAIHLRNGIVVHRKESIQAVYNWQYMASLALWTEVLSTQNKPLLEGLRFPLVQLIIGAAKLYPTPEYFPLKFHCMKMLSQISRSTRTFVPALPLVLEILDTYDFAKKHTKVSMKPLEFACILRVSGAQLAENGFKDVLVDAIYGALLEYLATEAHSICFPDIVLPVSICLKKFMKRHKIANFCRKLRQVLDKIEENVRFIENERKSVTFELSDRSAVEAWEKAIQVKGTPIATFYKSWSKVTAFNEAKKKTEKINIGDNIALMMNKKKKKTLQKGRSSDEGPVDLLPSDDSDDDDFFGADEDEEEAVAKPAKTKKRRAPLKKAQVKQAKKKAKLSKTQVDNDDVVGDDIVQDAALSEW